MKRTKLALRGETIRTLESDRLRRVGGGLHTFGPVSRDFGGCKDSDAGCIEVPTPIQTTPVLTRH